MDPSTKFGKEIPSRNLREKRSERVLTVQVSGSDSVPGPSPSF